MKLRIMISGMIGWCVLLLAHAAFGNHNVESDCWLATPVMCEAEPSLKRCSQFPFISVVADTTCSKTFFLENKRTVEDRAVMLGRFAEIKEVPA